MGPVRGEIQWNEISRVLVIKTVIHAEEEIRNNPNAKVSGKWDRINSLLPPHLRGRTWSYQQQKYNLYKCQRMFANLREAYKGTRRRKHKRSCELVLTKPVFEMMKKHEELLKTKRLKTKRSTPGEKGSTSRSPIRVSNSTGSASDQKLLSPSMNRFPNTHTNRGHSSERQTIGTATERKEERENFAFFPHTASASKQRLPWTTELHESFVDAVTELGGAGRALPEDVLRVMGVQCLTIYQVRSHLQMYDRLRYIAKSPWEGKKLDNESSEDVIATTHAPSTFHAGSSLGCMSKSLGESEGPENENKATGSIVGPTSKSVRETLQDPEKMATQTSAPARVQSGTETGAPGSRDRRWSTRPPFDHLPTFMSDSMAHTRYNEHLHSILDEPLRRLDLEFSSLRTWVESKLIPDGKKTMYGMTSSTIQSVKRGKLNAGTDPLDDVFHESWNRFIDLQIRASFQRLKVRFPKELKKTSMEIVQLVRQDIRLLYSFPDYSHRKRKCLFEEKSMSK